MGLYDSMEDVRLQLEKHLGTHHDHHVFCTRIGLHVYAVPKTHATDEDVRKVVDGSFGRMKHRQLVGISDIVLHIPTGKFIKHRWRPQFGVFVNGKPEVLPLSRTSWTFGVDLGADATCKQTCPTLINGHHPGCPHKKD